MELKKTYTILILTVVLFSGCISEKQILMPTTLLKTTTLEAITIKRAPPECLGCVFISYSRPHKIKDYVDFDVLTERAQEREYTISLLENSSSGEFNQTRFKRVIEIKKKIENYTAQIILSEVSYSNGTKLQSVERAYFGVTCDFDFARPKMMKILEELGITVEGYPPAYEGFPERSSQAIECNLIKYPQKEN